MVRLERAGGGEGFFGVVDGGVNLEELEDLGDFEDGAIAGAEACERDGVIHFGAADEEMDERTDSGAIEPNDIGEIEEERGGGIVAQIVIEGRDGFEIEIACHLDDLGAVGHLARVEGEGRRSHGEALYKRNVTAM